MRDDAVDGEELLIPWVPRLPREPSARRIAAHELTGHAVYRSWCRHCVASKGRARAPLPPQKRESCQTWASTMASLVVTEKMWCRSCVANAEGVPTGCLTATVIDKEGCVRICEFVRDSMHCEFWEFKRILVRSDIELSLSRLIDVRDEMRDETRDTRHETGERRKERGERREERDAIRREEREEREGWRRERERRRRERERGGEEREMREDEREME